jgi:uncharacterized Fe-S center protein
MKGTSMPSDLFFARFIPKNMEPGNSIGAKWLRLLDQLPLAEVVAKKRTAIKMHLGGGMGFSTVHPLFVRKLVEKVRAAGASDVFVTDVPGDVRVAMERGYTAETIGCQIIPITGTADRYCYKQAIKPAFKTLKEVELAGEIVDAEALIDLSHVKGHGACGFGGASKNLAMGCVTGRTRGAIHALEGGLKWDKKKCTRCGKCVENCPNQAMKFNEQKELNVFYHHCKFCQHCVLICPKHAIEMIGGAYRDFQKGLALVTKQVLATFEPKHTYFINFLMDVTIYCDCWGMTTPALVPDIGILAGPDIVAIEQASLDLIRTEDFIPSALPPGWKLQPGDHLLERVHGKDPFVLVECLAQLKQGSRAYRLKEID